MVVVSSTQNICNIIQDCTVLLARRPQYKHDDDDAGDDDGHNGDDYTDGCYFIVIKYQNECPKLKVHNVLYNVKQESFYLSQCFVLCADS